MSECHNESKMEYRQAMNVNIERSHQVRWFHGESVVEKRCSATWDEYPYEIKGVSQREKIQERQKE